MNTVAKLEAELLEIAIKRVIAAGLTVNEEDVTLILRVKGHGRHHDGWSTVISDDDWTKILALPWKSNVEIMFRALRARNNEPLTGEELEDTFDVGTESYALATEVNRFFQPNFLPFILSAVTTLPRRKRRQEGRYRLFNKRPLASPAK